MGLNLTNQYISASFQNLLQISGSDQVTDGLGNRKTSLDISASYAPSSTTASYALDSEKLGGKDSATYATTGSNTFTDIQTINNSGGTAQLIFGTVNVASGGVISSDGFTGSLQGNATTATTSSYSDFALTASFAINSTPQVSASYATSASHAENANTASNARKVDINAPLDWKYIVGTDGDTGFQKLYGNLPQVNNTTNAISASTFIGALQGNATSATIASTATSANKVSIQSPGFDWKYITSVDGLGTQFVYANGPQINDQLNAISASSFTGSLHGTASYALNANVDSGSWDGQYSASAPVNIETSLVAIESDVRINGIPGNQYALQVNPETGSLSAVQATVDGTGSNGYPIAYQGVYGQLPNIVTMAIQFDATDTGSVKPTLYMDSNGNGSRIISEDLFTIDILNGDPLTINAPTVFTAGATGSLFGTASYADVATNAFSASIANTATTALLATTASHAIYAETAGTAGTSQYSDNTIVYGKNLSGGTIEKGTPLYFTGSGTAGNVVGVYPADASNPARMPAAGVAGEQMLDEAEGVVLLDGFINGVDTTGFQSGQAVYVGVGGGYQATRPTGSNNLVQSLGYIEKVAVNGSGVIKGSGRANDVPNIEQGYVWVGGPGDIATTIPTSSLTTEWDGTFTGDASITGSLTVSSSLTVDGVKSDGSKKVSIVDDNGYEVVKVEGLLANKRDTSLFISGGVEIFQPTFQTRFQVTGLNGSTVFTGGNIGANDGSGTYSAGIAGANGGVLQVTNNTTSDDFGFAGQMEQWGYLGDWTGPGIWSNDPSGNYPTIVGFENASTWTDGRVTFLTPISASAGVTGSLNVSGALSTTGNITATNGYVAAFNGNDIFTTVGGNIENRVGTLANNTEKDLVQFGPVTDQYGNTYNLAHNLLANYLSYGKFYRGAFGVEFWDSYGYNYGNEFYVSPLGTRYQMVSPQGKFGADTFEVKTSGTNIGDTKKSMTVQEYFVGANGDTPEAVGYLVTNPSGSLAASSSYASFGLGQAYSDPTKSSYSAQANLINFGNYGPNSGDCTISFGGSHGKAVYMATSGSVFTLSEGAGFPYATLQTDNRINLYSQNINISGSGYINVDAVDTYITSDVEITGSVNISETIKLAPQNPLPTGALGELAVSGSGLYFHNGTSWGQIN